MKGMWILSLGLGLVVACPTASMATVTRPDVKYTVSFTPTYVPSSWTSERGYLPQAAGKLTFGGKNALLGWMELYNEPRDAVRAKQGFLRGMGRGLANMVGDTIGGVVQLATFPITAIDVTLPEGGTDIL